MSKWASTKLRELVGSPISGSRPAGGVNTETEGVPSLGGENILATGGITFDNLNRVSSSFYKAMPKGRLQSFDVLINKDGAQTGKVGLYKGDFSDACVNEHVFILRNQNKSNDQRFLFYSVLLPETQKKIARRITGSAQPGLNTTFVDAVDILIPSSPAEQSHIAEILSVMDTNIEKTEALIAKYQQIKAGLMHDLFTRGVTADGKLRPPREQAPELYQETPIGWIPKEWEVGSLAKFLIGGPKNGYSPPEISEWSGFFSLGLGCLTASGFRPRQIKVVSGTSDAACAAIVNDGDLLLSRSNTRELVGLCGIYHDIGGTCIYPDLMMRIKPNAKTSAAYLEAFLLTPKMRLQITAAAVGTSVSMVKLNSKSVLRLEISMPKPDEQLQILRVIEAQRSQLETFEEELSKLRQQKSGLMHDLLTGRITVAPLSEKQEALA